MNELVAKLQELSVGTSAIIGLVLMGFYYALFFNDGSILEGAIAQHEGRISELRAQRDKLDGDIVRVNEFKITMKEMGDRVELYRQYLPNALSSNDLMKLVSQEAKTAGLDISLTGGSSSGFNAVSENKPYVPVSIDADLKGPFGQHLLFLSFLTRAKLLITVGDFQFSSIAASGGTLDSENQLTFKVTLSGYRFKDVDKEIPSE